MRGYIDENDKKNEIRLLFKHPLYKDRILIVVEGMSDVKLFRDILSNDSIRLETIDGKNNLISVMKSLTLEFPAKILAICDADHDHLTGYTQELSKYSIFLTDYHDAEVMMLTSPALRSVINEYSTPESVEELHLNLFNNALAAAYPIGFLRWINANENLGLKFKGLNFNRFIDVNKATVNIDTKILIDDILSRSPNKSQNATKEYLISQMNLCNSSGLCRFQVASGHDLTNIISIIYRQKWASNDLNMDHKKIESSLRIGYRFDYFRTTALYNSMSTFLFSVGIEIER